MSDVHHHDHEDEETHEPPKRHHWFRNFLYVVAIGALVVAGIGVGAYYGKSDNKLSSTVAGLETTMKGYGGLPGRVSALESDVATLKQAPAAVQAADLSSLKQQEQANATAIAQAQADIEALKKAAASAPSPQANADSTKTEPPKPATNATVPPAKAADTPTTDKKVADEKPPVPPKDIPNAAPKTDDKTASAPAKDATKEPAKPIVSASEQDAISRAKKLYSDW